MTTVLRFDLDNSFTRAKAEMLEHTQEAVFVRTGWDTSVTAGAGEIVVEVPNDVPEKEIPAIKKAVTGSIHAQTHWRVQDVTSEEVERESTVVQRDTRHVY